MRPAARLMPENRGANELEKIEAEQRDGHAAELAGLFMRLRAEFPPHGRKARGEHDNENKECLRHDSMENAEDDCRLGRDVCFDEHAQSTEDGL